MFTYVASPSPRGNETTRRACSHCGKAFYIKAGAQGFRCPHCDWKQ